MTSPCRAARLPVVVVLGALAATGLATCGGLKEAPRDEVSPNEADPTGTSPGDGAAADGGKPWQDAARSIANGDGTGLALLGGFCCTQDADCRYHRCEDAGDGVKRCVDLCRTDGACQNAATKGLGFTCDWNESSEYQGTCAAPEGFTCIPVEKHRPGIRPDGACCAATGDGMAGSECLGGLCSAWYEGPFACTRYCETPHDCPLPFVCDLDVRQCRPADRDYTCQ